MKKIFTLILVIISVQSFGQIPVDFKLYAERKNTDNTVDSFIVKAIRDDSVFSILGAYVCPTVESFAGQFEPSYPQGFANYTKCADGVYRNYNPRSEYAIKSNTVNFGIDNGANDSYVITLSPAPLEYTNGMMILFRANTVNTGAASINVHGLGARTIFRL
jgi:hypothetical protein